MTQENKNLLLIDICTRLPYHPIVYVDENLPRLKLSAATRVWEYVAVDKPCKPYLRPMSSITEEEIEELAFIRDRDFQSVRKWINDESIKETRNICPITYGEVDFCNKKHLDYRGLIEKGLAIAVNENNNPYKK